MTFGSAVTESATASETNAASVTFGVLVLETGTGADVVTVNFKPALLVSETATASDEVERRLLWEPINTSQTANWVPITT